jgi:hypothetical protein
VVTNTIYQQLVDPQMVPSVPSPNGQMVDLLCRLQSKGLPWNTGNGYWVHPGGKTWRPGDKIAGFEWISCISCWPCCEVNSHINPRLRKGDVHPKSNTHAEGHLWKQRCSLPASWTSATKRLKRKPLFEKKTLTSFFWVRPPLQLVGGFSVILP